VVEAANDEVWPVLEATELTPCEAVQVGGIVRQSVLQGTFDPGVAGLLGVEVRGVGRQVGHREVARVRSKEGSRPMCAVGIKPVPDDQEGSADLSPEVLQGLDHRAACDAASEVPCIQPPGRRDRDDTGDLASLADTPEHGTVRNSVWDRVIRW
jgi:hypothetical protein